jgi:NADPH2:quinone reductase
MRAVFARAFGSIDSVEIADLPDPSPGPGEVLIQVTAAGVNFPDLLVIQGLYQNKPPLPFIPGKEAAGTVLAVGEGVTTCKPGDRVLTMIEYGCWCQRLVAPQSCVFVIPDSMDLVDASAFALIHQTAYFALVVRGGLKAGEWVLVTGAAGGVGLACVQLAHALGAKVVAGVSTPEKAALAKAAGADAVIDLSVPNLKDAIRDQVRTATDGHGADIICEVVGGDVFDGAIRALAWSGRMVVLGFAGGRIPSVSANYVLVKNISVIGMHWSDYRDGHPHIMRAAQDHMFQLFEQGKLPAPRPTLYALEDVTQAMHQLKDRVVVGKVAIDLR